MKKSSLFLIIILLAFKSYTQEKRVFIVGKIIADSTSVEDIHIINKTTKKATTSDSKGRFRMPVKVNDTLLFSAVQFENKIIIINKVHIKNLSITVAIKSAVNQLSEVSIKKSKNIAKGLGLPNAGKKPLNNLENTLNAHTKASLPVAILAAILNKRGGINDMFYIISGNRKKDRKLSKLIDSDKFNLYQSQQIQEIKKQYKEVFFTKTLKLPKVEIDYFIKFCDSKEDVVYLFSKNRHLEVIDIFIKESKPYLKNIENEE